jgi:3-deoxy-D-manno-octulosonic acid hydroxylase-like protein
VIESVVKEIRVQDWNCATDGATRAEARDALESGCVLFFPLLTFQIEDDEREFLTPSVANGRAKNISLDPATGRLQGMSVSGEEERRLAAMIERFGARATKFVEELLGYRNVERARTSYRPVEVEGRIYSPIKDDRLLHVDAFPSRPMRGRRILRFFSNVAPSRSRNWEVGESFETFAQKFLPHVRPSPPGQSWLFEKLGVTKGRRTHYDELMLALHDACKRDSDYQKNGPHTALSFPPGTSWLVFTDQVLHAALGGAFALEQTFHLDIREMREPSRSPLKVLERMKGRALV